MIKILIVEDDPMVAHLNKRYVENIMGFKVVGQVNNGIEALNFCKKTSVDLIILDVYMPKLDGISFLKELRKNEIHADVILVTASKEIETIDEALKLGAVDYLIKPFEYERFKSALANYTERFNLMQQNSISKQNELDKIFSQKCNTHDSGLQKGLHPKTLNRIRDFLKSNPDYFTSEEIANEISLTKVTIRRYLEYLESTGEVKLEIEYGAVGRPTHLYKYIDL